MRYKMIISYDGAYFHGFQRQPKDISVQEILEQKLSIVFKNKIIVNPAGRTDAFVHAVGQVVHFDSEQLIPTENLRKVMNKHLYPHIYIKDITYVKDTFHARKSAIKKEYHYYVSINEYNPIKTNYVLYFHDRLDIGLIRKAMIYIVGTHDFKSFSKNHLIKTTIRTIESFTLDIKDGILTFKIIGDGFLHNMVRIIIALMLKVGEGKIPVSQVPKLMAEKSRQAIPYVAPAKGLYLWKVYYDEDKYQLN